MALNKTSPYLLTTDERYRQGDILRNITVVEWAEIKDGKLEVIERILKYCVVLSQECDLEHDFNNRGDTSKPSQDKFLTSILLCPAYPAEQLRLGKHLEDLNQKMQSFSSENWKQLKQNTNYRYHFLPEHVDSQIPDLALDFKHYITVPTTIAYRDAMKKNVLASLDDLFREHLSSRFAHYLSRIGLPEIESA
jgi:hypothetical protein